MVFQEIVFKVLDVKVDFLVGFLIKFMCYK